MPVNEFVLLLAVAVVALAGGIGLAYVLFRRRQRDGSPLLELKAHQTLAEAETQAKE